MAEKQPNPAKYFVASFAVAILVGAFLLALPFSSAEKGGTGIIDALFTATSATCVTGLVVVDTGAHFSRFGQAVLVLLMQLGGLGIMTFSVFAGVVLGRGVGIWQRQIMQDSFGTQYTGRVSGLVVRIILMVLAIEGTGVLFLFIHWRKTAKTTSKALWLATFHSVSAFNNAGFSTFSNNLEKFHDDYFVNVVIMLLIILGGLGFVTLFELLRLIRRKKNVHSLSLHSHTVLITTGFLILGGATFIYLLESFRVLKGLGSAEGFIAALFQSVTARTAGFNTIPIGALSNSTLLIITILMFIGASPGSTGGGVKTTTAAIFFADLKSYLRGREPEMWERSIDRATVEKAYLIIIICLTLVIVSTFLLMIFEPEMDAMDIVFEVVSAFGTVGLSAGITPHLSTAGKIVIIIVMYAGRVGPLTLALAVGSRSIGGDYRYPEGKIFVG